MSGLIELNDTITSNFYSCVDGLPGSATPVLEVNDCESLGLWDYTGGLKLTNIVTAGSNISVNFGSGRLIVDSSSTQGSIIVRGIGSISGTTGGTTVNDIGLIDNASIWNETIADHLTAGSVGKALSDAGSAGNPWGSPITGNTNPGTFGEFVVKKLLTLKKFIGLS